LEIPSKGGTHCKRHFKKRRLQVQKIICQKKRENTYGSGKLPKRGHGVHSPNLRLGLGTWEKHFNFADQKSKKEQKRGGRELRDKDSLH